MPLVDLKTIPSKPTQRWFGVSLAGLLLLLGFMLGHWGGEASWPAWPRVAQITLWSLAAATLCLYYAVPAWQIPIIRGWQYVTFPIAWCVGHLLLILAFFCVFLPIGWIMRRVGYDPLRLRRSDRKSEWIPRESPSSASRYFKQY